MLMSARTPLSELEDDSLFATRHIGPDANEQRHMLSVIGAASRQALIDAVVPRTIARSKPMQLPPAASEAQALAELRALAGRNQVFRSFIGQGYHGTLTPGVIQRNILENPAWYTAYTPYQAEISQGRLEALINFQTMVCDLTGMAVANASMLDEATAAAEAMTLARRSVRSKSDTIIVASDCHPQTIDVVRTRAKPLGLKVLVGFAPTLMQQHDYFAVLAQYPSTSGLIHDLRPSVEQAHAKQAAFIVATDLLALTLLKAPGEFDADIVVGNSQRFGVPMGCGGPHAAFMACRDEFKRSLPGRLVGASIDSHGQPAYRLALQTREQHIRREKATSNICTAQVLLAVIASMYAVYHGPQGLKRIAQRVASYTAALADGLGQLGFENASPHAFDTITVDAGERTDAIVRRARDAGTNLRLLAPGRIGIALDETTTRDDVSALWSWFAAAGQTLPQWASYEKGIEPLIPPALRRASDFLTHPVFNTHHSETEMLRYIRSLADKDLALDRSMIPLGSCTMKLNATSEMIPITWPEFANLHPFAPADQLAGMHALNDQLCQWLAQATGYSGISLQPNAGSQGEYAGLLAIKAWHESRGDAQRRVCLIPESAHGTNPASAHMAGLDVVVVKCDAMGNVDLDDLRAKCEQHRSALAAVMITYPSTYGIFEPRVKELCTIVHQHGGRVYVDGANMNALVGLAAPGEFGGDVSHLNLHKTFCIPHGGGGPGVGPVCVVKDLEPFLPAAPGSASDAPVGAVSAAPLGNAGVLPISWMYIRMMGAEGLTAATECAILAANYVAARLADHYDIHYSGDVAGIKGGGVAHECILDLRPLKGQLRHHGRGRGQAADRLRVPRADVELSGGRHADGRTHRERAAGGTRPLLRRDDRDPQGNRRSRRRPLAARRQPAQARATHCGRIARRRLEHAYTREQAAYPLKSLKHRKYWSPVGRVDNVHGDRNLFCSCVPMSAFAED